MEVPLWLVVTQAIRGPSIAAGILTYYAGKKIKKEKSERRYLLKK
jgi:hypothetical protein